MITFSPIRRVSREWTFLAQLRWRARAGSFVLLATLLLQIVAGVLASTDAKRTEAADFAAISFCAWQAGPQLADNGSPNGADDGLPVSRTSGFHCVFCTPLMQSAAIVSASPPALSASLPGFNALSPLAAEIWLADVLVWGSAAPQAPPVA